MGEELKQKLFNPRKDGWDSANEEEREAIFGLSKK